MWLCDLEKAIADLRKYCPDYLFDKIVPAGSGIAFYTTHFSRVLWCGHNSLIIEKYEDGTEKTIREMLWG